VQNSNDIQDVRWAQDNTIDFKNVKDNTGTVAKKRKREEHAQIASSTVQESHYDRKGSYQSRKAQNQLYGNHCKFILLA
jgi:hypothetical protein